MKYIIIIFLTIILILLALFTFYLGITIGRNDIYKQRDSERIIDIVSDNLKVSDNLLIDCVPQQSKCNIVYSKKNCLKKDNLSEDGKVAYLSLECISDYADGTRENPNIFRDWANKYK